MTTSILKREKTPTTLAIDIGGTAIKLMVIDAKGAPLTEYLIEKTPQPATVKAVCHLLLQMIARLALPFDRISAGFPGVIKNGIIFTAVNMHPSWIGINFERELQRLTRRKARVANDADVQGYGTVSGHGVELVITLGTGLGSALFLDGKLIPNLELGHHPFSDNQTYEQKLGKAALERDGLQIWQANLKKAIPLWLQTFNCDRLYLGGGFAHKINFELPSGVILSNNVEGVLGGLKLWEA